jgi:spermidine synthase
LWSLQLSSGIGHEIAAVYGVLAAIFLGLALGSGSLGRCAERSPNPLRWVIGLEIGIGLFGLSSTWLIPHLTPLVSTSLGVSPPTALLWAAAFLVPGLLFLPATMAMGATVVAMARLGGQAEENPRHRESALSLSWIFGANTAGAVAGALLAPMVLVPVLGLKLTAVVAAGLNVAAAVLVWRYPNLRALPPAAPTAPYASNEKAHSRRTSLFVLALGGLLSIAYETLCVRVLSQVTENTVYSYAMILAVFLSATAVGAFWHHRPSMDLAAELFRTGIAVALGGVGLWWADLLSAWPVNFLGPGAWAALGGEALAAAGALGLPALAMGRLFSAAWSLSQSLGGSAGKALAVNTFAASLAPWIVGVLAIPHVGSARTLALIGAAYAIAAAVLVLRRTARPAWSWGALASSALAGALIWILPPLRFVDVEPGGRIRAWKEGVMASVSITEDKQGIMRLKINNRAQEGSSAASPVEMRLALIPLLLHDRPRSALFLGVGTGFTAHVAALDMGLDVDAVELLPEVTAAASWFMRQPGAPAPQHPPTLLTADARRYVSATPKRYDLVVSDLFHPARSGAGSLYTVEHFEAVRERLEPDGIFCQWLALHQMELGTFDSILAAFVQVFPKGVAVLASNSLDTPVIGLVARPDRPVWAWASVQARFDAASPAVRPYLDRARLTDAYAVLGSFTAGPQALQGRVQGVRPNTDDHPIVVHSAPWDTYSGPSMPRMRLQQWLSQAAAAQTHHTQPEDIGLVPNEPRAVELSAYRRARDHYIEIGLNARPEAGAASMLQTVGPALTELTSLSPQFTPALDALAYLRAAAQASTSALP